MNREKLLELAGQLMLAGVTHQDEEIEKISEQLAAELRQPINTNGANAPREEQDKIGFLNFTKQEILKMPTKFRKYFIAANKLVHVRRRKRNKKGYYTYEARYRCGDYNISVSSNNPDKLKEKFIQAVNLHDCGKHINYDVPTTFCEFADYYLENIWKRTVSDDTYKNEMNRYKKYIKPWFGSTPLKRVTSIACQALLDKISEKGYGKTTDEVHTRLNMIFEAAICHSIITHNPLKLVMHTPHERVNGVPLTKDEEKYLIEVTENTPYQLMFVVALYTGLRPCEYATARIDGDFIVAQNKKRKSRKVEYKKIPITPMLRPFLVNVTELRFYVPQRIREKFRKLLPKHVLKDLRLTFSTHCVECHIDDIARKLFMGHSLTKMQKAYIKPSDEYLLQEGQKFVYKVAPDFAPKIDENNTHKE